MGGGRRRRAAVDLSKGQTGDVTTGGIAGNDYIANNLADIPEGLARVLADSHEYSQLMVTSLDRLSTQLQRSIDRVRDDLDIYRATEASERRARQAEMDKRMERLVADVAETQRLGREARQWMIGLTVALVVVVFAVVAVVLDRVLAAAGTAAAVALASWLARGR